MAPPALLLALAVVLPALLPGAIGRLACESSGYCSLGKVKPWSGDIRTSQGLRNMLEARSYKKELIIAGSHNAHRQMYLWMSNLEMLGFEHHVIIGLTQEYCKTFTAKKPDMGAPMEFAWLSQPQLSRLV